MKTQKLILFIAATMLVSFSTTATQAKSLWSENSPFNNLVIDGNASKVGDILTIIIQESNRANDTADSEAERGHQVNGIFSMIFNNRFMNKVFGNASDAPQLSFSSNNNFEGETAVDRSSEFSSRVAATVVQVDPVGNFLIEARKTIRIGEEHKTIILSGKVRPRDIVNNTVLSTHVADAEISYLGDGTITNMANPTILQRLFGYLF